MNWEMLAAVGQLAAVCVGIPSLIYLAVQIREQTKERRQSAVNALTEQWGALTESLHNNPEMAAIFLRGAQSFSDLDSVSKLRFSAFFNRLLNIFEGMYFSHAQGILIGSSWKAVERTMTDLIAYPGVQQWWESRKHWHTEEFDRLVRDIIAKGNKPTAFSTYDLSQVQLPGEARER
jgi:hypothetical protein